MSEPNLTLGCLCRRGSPLRGPAAWPSLGSALGVLELILSVLPILAGRTCPSLALRSCAGRRGWQQGEA